MMSKDSENRDVQPNTSYSYSNGYGNAYYGEGYGAGYGSNAGQDSPSRSLGDYILLLRERIWWLVLTVFVVFMGAAIFTFNATEIYRSTSTVQVLRQQDNISQFENVMNTDVRSSEDFNTQIRILQSMTIIERVATRIKDADYKQFMEPYASEDFLGQRSVMEILAKNRSIDPVRMTLIVAISYDHPDPEITARVANYFAEEYINYNLNQKMERSLSAMDDLKSKAEQQRQKVEALERELSAFKEEYGALSLDAETDTDRQQLLRLDEIATADKRVVDEWQVKVELIEEVRKREGNLWDLSFIAESSRIPSLLQNLTDTKVLCATLGKSYRHKHPRMLAAQESLSQNKQELAAAVDSAANAIYNSYHTANLNYENSIRKLKEQKAAILKLEEVSPEYRRIDRDLAQAEVIYKHFYSRMQQVRTMASDDTQSALIVDRATVPMNPYKPNILLNLVIGLFLGTGLGLVIVYLLVILDDRVKTAFDIENYIGVPLVGIVPRIVKGDNLEKARASVSHVDKHAMEAFRGIHSSLNINESSKNAKVILTTSTIPSEGKSFISSNIGFTFASHGEKTIIVDADLRMPNVAKSLGLENDKGVLQIVSGEATLDDVIQKDVEANTDVLVTGGRTKNPTQILCHQNFAKLIGELRERYDRVIIDSPPLAPVSDSLNMLSLVDGVVYVIRFNMVKRKAAVINTRKLKDTDVPVFGAILNNINANVAGYYYSHYYDKSYRQYYLKGGRPDEVREEKRQAKLAKKS